MTWSLEEQLLYSSLLCGLAPGGEPIYRLQLFFVANKELSSKNHQSDFQRALETGVDAKEYWENWPRRGFGEYRITQKGYNRALDLFGQVKPKYSPRSKRDCSFSLEGYIGQRKVVLESQGGKTSVFINDRRCHSAKEACSLLEDDLRERIPTQGDSAARILYNLAIDKDFQMRWES